MKLFKLTDFRSRTYRDTQWGKNVTHSVLKRNQGTELCSPGVIHAYKNLNLALLLNPIHSSFITFKVWEAKGKVVVEDWGKVGCWELTTLEELDLPDWYTDSYKRKRVQVRFAILCAKKVLKYFEDIYPDDQRPRKAIEVGQDFLKTERKKLGTRAAALADHAANDAAYDAASDVGQKGRLISTVANAAYAAHIAASDAAHTAANVVGATGNAARAARAAGAAYRVTNKDVKFTINFSTLADKAVLNEEKNNE